MDDPALVGALIAGDAHGLEGVYRRYADRLYAYCRGLLREPDAATEVVHDTLVLASLRAVQLRDPDRLRPWLYAIARNECLRRGRRPRPPVAAADETVELVRAAVDSLPTGDREVFELVVRHSLLAQDVSDVLGISVGHVHARLARARAHLAKALGYADQAALFTAYAEQPFPDLPAELWPRLELRCLDPGLELEREAILQRAGTFDRETGFPRPLDVRRRRRLVTAGVAGVAAAALAAAAAGAAIPPPRPAAPPPQALPTTPVPEPARPLPGATPEPSAGSGPTAPAGAATPGASPLPPSPPLSTSSAVPPPLLPPPPGDPSLTVDADAAVDCGFVLGYELVASTMASEPLATADLFLRVGSGNAVAYPLEVDGASAAGRSEPQLDEGEAQWWVAVSTVDDQRAETSPAALNPDC